MNNNQPPNTSALLANFPSPDDAAKKLLFASKRIGDEFGYLNVLLDFASAITTYGVSIVKSAQEAIDLVQRSNIEVLILDAFVDGPENNPGLGPYQQFPAYLRDGLWALDQIRAIRPSQRVVAIIDEILDLESFCMLQGAEKVFTVPYCTRPLFDYLVEKDPGIKRMRRAINE